MKKGEMEHEMNLCHAIEPIEKCFVPYTPFYDYLWSIEHKMALPGIIITMDT